MYSEVLSTLKTSQDAIEDTGTAKTFPSQICPVKCPKLLLQYLPTGVVTASAARALRDVARARLAEGRGARRLPSLRRRQDPAVPRGLAGAATLRARGPLRPLGHDALPLHHLVP